MMTIFATSLQLFTFIFSDQKKGNKTKKTTKMNENGSDNSMITNVSYTHITLQKLAHAIAFSAVKNENFSEKKK